MSTISEPIIESKKLTFINPNNSNENSHSQSLPKKIEKFIRKFNNFSETIYTLFIHNQQKSIQEDHFLDILLNSLLHEKSDSLKLEILNFLNENFNSLINACEDDKIHKTFYTLIEFFKEINFCTNQFLKINCIKTLTNCIVLFDAKNKFPATFEYFTRNLLTIIRNNKTINRFIRAAACQSLSEIEDFYPGTFFLEIYKENTIDIRTRILQSNDIIDNSNKISLTSANPFYRKSLMNTISKTSSIISNVPEFVEALSIRNFSLAAHSTLLEKNDNKLIDYSLLSYCTNEKTNIFPFYLMFLIQIIKSFTMKKEQCGDIGNIYLCNKVNDDAKKVISLLLSDIDNFTYFTKNIILDELSWLLKYNSVSSKIVLPIYANMLKASGNLNILGILSILPIFYYEFDKTICKNLIKRMFSDVNSPNLCNNEKYLILHWINNLTCFLPELEKEEKFEGLLKENIHRLLPKPGDSYILREKKLLTYLDFIKFKKNISTKMVLDLFQNFQIFKNFSIESDITTTFFRIIYIFLEKLPFQKYVSEICEFIFEILQYKPKFSFCVLELLEKLKNSNNFIVVQKEKKEQFLTKNEILTIFFEGFANFLTKLEPAININNYLSIVKYTVKEPFITPKKILYSLFKLCNVLDQLSSSRERYIASENILFISKTIVHIYHIKDIHEDLLKIYEKLSNSEEITIKDTANIYKLLLNNLNQNKIEKIFIKKPKFNNDLFSYNIAKKYKIIEKQEKEEIIILTKSIEERKKLGIFDKNSAIFGDFSEYISKTTFYCENDLFTDFLSLDLFGNEFSLFENLSYNKENSTICSNDIAKLLNPLDLQEKQLKSCDEFFELKKTIESKFLNKFQQKENVKIKEIFEICLKFCKNQEDFEEFQKEIYNVFIENLSQNQFILLPLILELNNISDIGDTLLSIIIIFSKSKNYIDIPNFFIPFLSKDFPLKYKILLKIEINTPNPLEIETGFCFTNNNNDIFLLKGNNIYINFEELFLPIKFKEENINKILNKDLNLKNEEIINENGLENFYKFALFEFIWGKDNLIECRKILNNKKNNIFKLIDNHLKHFSIFEPLEIPFDKKKFEFNNNINKFFDNFYDVLEKFDFESEKNFEMNNGKELSEFISLGYFFIFLPKEYFLLMKLAIHDFVTVIFIKTNRCEILKYLDYYFENWNL